MLDLAPAYSAIAWYLHHRGEAAEYLAARGRNSVSHGGRVCWRERGTARGWKLPVGGSSEAEQAAIECLLISLAA